MAMALIRYWTPPPYPPLPSHPFRLPHNTHLLAFLLLQIYPQISSSKTFRYNRVSFQDLWVSSRLISNICAYLHMSEYCKRFWCIVQSGAAEGINPKSLLICIPTLLEGLGFSCGEGETGLSCMNAIVLYLDRLRRVRACSRGSSKLASTELCAWRFTWKTLWLFYEPGKACSLRALPNIRHLHPKTINNSLKVEYCLMIIVPTHKHKSPFKQSNIIYIFTSRQVIVTVHIHSRKKILKS
jgi:hypothetical protein